MNLHKKLQQYLALNSYVEKVQNNTNTAELMDAIHDGLTSLMVKGTSKNVPETYLDSVIAKGKCEQRNLPIEYTELAYLQSSGTQYIDTGGNPHQDSPE